MNFRKRNRVSGAACSAWLSGILILVFISMAGATPGGEPGYPKTIAYLYHPSSKTEAELDSLSRFDLLLGYYTPEVIEGLEQRNPHQKRLWNIMPVVIVDWDEEATYWVADTTYSLYRLCQYYAQRNDWYLYDINGNRIREWGDGYFTVNWTRYCPKGVYGTSVGMTYAEWFIHVAVPQVSKNNPAWEDWGMESSSLQGLSFEVFDDCINEVAPEDQFLLADPDRDGLAEGISSYCWDGGTDDSLSILFRETNEYFREQFRATWGDDFILVVNRGSPSVGPLFIDEFNGTKLESWTAWHGSGEPDDPISWWPTFYGSFDAQGNWKKQGYLFAEQMQHPTGIDENEGWDWSFIQVLAERWGPWPDEGKHQVKRFGVGTSMLGEGYFMMAPYSGYNAGSYWFPEYDWDFGDPAGDFGKEIIQGASADTIYYRLFEKGLVEVNPYGRIVDGIAAKDSEFNFWLTLEDLSTGAVSANSVDLSWEVPDGEINSVDDFEVRYATSPVTLTNWSQAGRVDFDYIAGGYDPGDQVTLTVADLEPNTTYHFGVRNIVRDYLEPITMSNSVSATTLPPVAPDETEPGAITDLSVPVLATDLISFSWTATGDDGFEGVADHYLFRYLVGETIMTEVDWENGADVPEQYLPVPLASGAEQLLSVSGFVPGTTYGFCIRVVDEAGNVSAISNPLLVTIPLPDEVAPAAVDDLSGTAYLTGLVSFSWSATGDDDLDGLADHYQFRFLAGGAITTETDWENGFPIPEQTLPVPLAAGEEQIFSFPGFAQGAAYGFCVRVVDESENVSALSNPLLLTIPLADVIAPAAVDDLDTLSVGADQIDLTWTATGDDGSSGTASAYILGYLTGQPITTETHWTEAVKVDTGLPDPLIAGTTQSWELGGLTPETGYGLALRVYDDEALLSELGSPLFVTTDAEVSPPDLIRPATVNEIEIVQEYEDGFLLNWIAPGDDDVSGMANRYSLGYLNNQLIDSESDWLLADTLVSGSDNFPWPDSAGTNESFRLPGLAAETFYGLAVRAYDEEGNRSLLPSIALGGWTLAESPLGDGIAPAPITLLFVNEIEPSSALLSWACTGDDSTSGVAESFILAWIEGAGPITEDEWESATRITTGLPLPGQPDSIVTYYLESLSAETTYCFGVRVLDEEDNLSDCGSSLSFTTPFWPDITAPDRVDDLTGELIGELVALLSWTAAGDDGSTGTADSLQIAKQVEGDISTPEDWLEATVISLVNETGSGGSASYQWTELGYETEYTFAVRYGDEVGNWGEISNAVTLTTPPAADVTPPGRIETPVVTGIESDRVTLSWAAVGDDGLDGQAISYEAALLEDDAVTASNFAAAAANWTAFLSNSGGSPLPVPALAGLTEEYEITGLSQGGSYGFAIRALDEAGNEGEASINLGIDLPPPTVMEPPTRIDDLTVADLGTGWIAVSWTAPTAFKHFLGAADLYEIGYARVPVTITNWEAVLKGASPPVCGEPGETEHYTLGPIQSDEKYWIGLRSRDSSGQWSELSNIVSATTTSEDATPPGIPDAPNVTEPTAVGEDRLRISWLASFDPDVMGYNVYGRRSSETSRYQLNETLVLQTVAPDWWFARPAGNENFHVSISAVDFAGNESEPGSESALFSESFSLSGPFPHPIPLGTTALFKLVVPPVSSGVIQIDIQIHTVTGKIVKSGWPGQFDQDYPGGSEIHFSWDTRNDQGEVVAPGLYFLRISGGEFSEIRKIYVSQ